MENPNFCVEALKKIYPNSVWKLYGDSYDGLEWLSEDIPKPTLEEIEAEVERLQAEYDYNQYQRLRVLEYPSFADQFDLLYHGGYDAWKAEIDKVKEKYPKP